MIAILRFEQNQQFSRQLKAHSQMQDGVNSCWKKEPAIRAWVACVLMDITWVSDVYNFLRERILELFTHKVQPFSQSELFPKFLENFWIFYKK